MLPLPGKQKIFVLDREFWFLKPLLETLGVVISPLQSFSPAEEAIFHYLGGRDNPQEVYHFLSETRQAGGYIFWTPGFYNTTFTHLASQDMQSYTPDFSPVPWKDALGQADLLFPASYYELGLLAGQFDLPFPLQFEIFPLLTPYHFSAPPEPTLGLWNSWQICEGLDLLFRPGGWAYSLPSDIPLNLVCWPEEKAPDSTYAEALRRHLETAQRDLPLQICPVTTTEAAITALASSHVFWDASYEVPYGWQHLTMFLSGREVVCSPLGNVREELGGAVDYHFPLNGSPLEVLEKSWQRPWSGGPRLSQEEFQERQRTIFGSLLNLYT